MRPAEPPRRPAAKSSGKKMEAEKDSECAPFAVVKEQETKQDQGEGKKLSPRRTNMKVEEGKTVTVSS